MIPFTTLPTIYALTLAAVAVFAGIRDRHLWPVLAVMILNWIGTRAITAFDAPALAGAALDLTSAIVLVALVRAPAMAVLPVAAIFG